VKRIARGTQDGAGSIFEASVHFTLLLCMHVDEESSYAPVEENEVVDAPGAAPSRRKEDWRSDMVVEPSGRHSPGLRIV